MLDDDETLEAMRRCLVKPAVDEYMKCDEEVDLADYVAQKFTEVYDIVKKSVLPWVWENVEEDYVNYDEVKDFILTRLTQISDYYLSAGPGKDLNINDIPMNLNEFE